MGSKDPIKNYEQWLIESGIISEKDVAEVRNEFKEKIENELAIGFNTKTCRSRYRRRTGICLCEETRYRRQGTSDR